MLVLTIGDLYVPERAIDIPAKFKKLLQPKGKIDKVLCLGNITSSKTTYNFLQNISNDFQMVKGEFDELVSDLPQSLVFSLDNLKIGLINGFQIIPKNDPLSLLNHARMMDVDILIYGSTHKVEAYTLDGKFFINPGTGTGAYSTDPLDKEDKLMINKIIADKLKISNNAVKPDKNDKGQDKETDDNNKDNKDNKDTATATENQPETDKEEEQNETQKPVEGVKKQDGEVDIGELRINDDKQEQEHKTETTETRQDQVEDIDEDIDEYMTPFPSFCLLDIKDSTCTLYLYTLVDGDVKIDKLVYSKEQ